MSEILPERNFNSREDTLLKNTSEPTTSEVIILGEDLLLQSEAPDNTFKQYDPDFIGPRDAHDGSRGFLTQRAKDLALIAVQKFSAYEGERARLVATVHASVADGTIRLNTDYPKLPIDKQVEHFVMDSVNGSVKSKYEIESELAAERTQQNLGSKGPVRELQLEVNKQRELIEKQSNRILKVRGMLIEGGATEDFMRKFDYMFKLMTEPEQDVYEREMELDPEHEETPPLVDTAQLNLFDMFKNVLSPSFGRKALRSIGIRSPKSGQVEVVGQAEKALP